MAANVAPHGILVLPYCTQGTRKSRLCYCHHDQYGSARAILYIRFWGFMTDAQRTFAHCLGGRVQHQWIDVSEFLSIDWMHVQLAIASINLWFRVWGDKWLIVGINFMSCLMLCHTLPELCPTNRRENSPLMSSQMQRREDERLRLVCSIPATHAMEFPSDWSSIVLLPHFSLFPVTSSWLLN